MFNLSQSDVRRFFCGVRSKQTQLRSLEAVEILAARWMSEHPEYDADFADLDKALNSMQTSGVDRENPFLHLSMHLSISEQCSIDQPPGIRAAVERLAARRNNLHAAHHEVMNCLGQMVWESQRNGHPPDGQAYIRCVSERAMRF